MGSVTLGEVAARAGVSRGTVSNVLNHPERVKSPLQARVRAAMDELGFIRNEPARQLRSGSSTVFELSLLDTWNPYFNDVTRGIEDYLHDLGWTLSVSTNALDRKRERSSFELFQQRRVRGILAVPISDDSIHQLATIRGRGVGCVLVDRGVANLSVPSVSVDDVEGGRLAGAHLRSIGRLRIAFAGNPDVHTHAADRLRGLRIGAGDDAKIEVIATASVDIRSGVAVGAEIVSRPRSSRPQALFCANDLVAIGAMQVLMRERVIIPDEIAVVGYDDIEFASLGAIPLSTVHQPAYDLGRQSAQLLLEDIEDGLSSEPRHVVYAPRLIIRESTAGQDVRTDLFSSHASNQATSEPDAALLS